MIAALAVAGGAVVGAPLRYLVDRAVQSRHESRIPYGTLLVNLLACLVLGLVTGMMMMCSSRKSLMLSARFVMRLAPPPR